jgi:transposase
LYEYAKLRERAIELYRIYGDYDRVAKELGVNKRCVINWVTFYNR